MAKVCRIFVAVTASVYLKAGGSSSQTLNLFLVNVGDQGSLVASSSTVTLTTSWQRFDLSATLQNGLTFLYLQVGGGDSLAYGQSFQIWGAQFVIGSAPAPYTPTPSTTTLYATGTPGTLVQTGLNQTYTYDSFGNILQNGSFNSSYTANNQMFGYAYDAAGNLLSDGMNVMTWDAESRMSTAAGATYIYDAEGNRVEKQGSSVVDTVYFGGQPIARYTGGQWTDLIYGPTGLLAEVPGTQTGSPVYRVTDNLGTNVGSLLANGTFVDPMDHTPFGQTFTGNTSDPYFFTGKERDAESGLDNFGARYYGSSMGRFMSPDDGSDQDPSDPQSWNLYGYVRNNPLSNTDPDGHDCVTQVATPGGGEQATVNTGACSGGSGNGTTKTFIDGTVTSISYASDGKSLNVGYNATGSDPNTSASTASLGRAPAPDNPGISYGYNMAGYNQLANTSRVVSYFGNIGMATWGMIPLGDAGGLTSLGGLAGKVRIVEQDGNAIRAVVQTAKGPVTIVANMVKQGDQLVLTGVHVDGVGLSISEVRQAASALGRSEGAGEVVIQGGVRTSGANVGSTPTQIRVKVK